MDELSMMIALRLLGKDLASLNHEQLFEYCVQPNSDSCLSSEAGNFLCVSCWKRVGGGMPS